jgi:hypothetical protein
MQFLSAPLLFGLALAAVPLIIHLLNRRRFQLVDWAPMKYLKLTIKNNRRRVRIEQLLLLLLRTLVMIVVILAVARPVLSSGGLGSWLSHRARVSRIIVVDDSLPMGYRELGHTALDQAKAAAVEILRATGSQDAVTFLTTTPASTPWVNQISVEDSTKLQDRINAMRTTDAACDWAATFRTIDDCLNNATFPQKEVILITDLRKSGWNSGVSTLADKWAGAGISARIIDVGSRDTADVSLIRFEQEDPLALPGAPVNLMATIRNGSPAALTGATAALSIDGQSRPMILPDLPAGQATDVPLSVTLDQPGPHSVKLTLPDDALSGDNQRYLSLLVRERLEATLVDGRVGAGPFESAGDFVQLALTVGSSPWQIRRLTDSDAAADHPPRADMTVLADVANLSSGAAAEYEKLVRQGMGLMIFAGEQTDPVAYNHLLYRNGQGLLPVALDHIADGPVQGLIVEGLGDSPLAALAKIAPAALAKIQTRRLMLVDSPPRGAEEVRVLARWNDPEGHPAVIEKRLGKGRVLLWTTSADREWTDWPVDPTYVLAVRSAAISAAWPDGGQFNLVAGHPMEYTLPDNRPVSAARLMVPEESTPLPLAFEGNVFRYPHTERAGPYGLTWIDNVGKSQRADFSSSFDVKAADLTPLTASELADLLGNLKAEVLPYRPGILLASAPGREIWRMLAGSLLAILVAETLMAFWVGRER